jgi:hypothetical protein
VDIPLSCRDCNEAFTFSVADQEFFKSKGWENQPVRCDGCRKAKKAQQQGSGGGFGGGDRGFGGGAFGSSRPRGGMGGGASGGNACCEFFLHPPSLVLITQKIRLLT